MHNSNCCDSHNNGVNQTLDELDFERGIWSAAQFGDLNRIKMLLSKSGSDVNARTTGEYTALHYAARNGHLEAVKYLIEMGADVNAVTKCAKATALHKACTAGHFKVVEYLINHGADLKLVDDEGKTVLHRAAQNKNLDIINLIQSKSNDLQMVYDKKGKLPNDYL